MFFLRDVGKAARAEVRFQISLVGVFAVARSELAMDRHRSADDPIGQSIVGSLDEFVLHSLTSWIGNVGFG